MALLVIGFFWAHKTGEWRALQNPIKFNKDRENRRPQYSFFRYGLDLIRDAVLHATTGLKNYIELLFSPVLAKEEAIL